MKVRIAAAVLAALASPSVRADGPQRRMANTVAVLGEPDRPARPVRAGLDVGALGIEEPAPLGRPSSRSASRTRFSPASERFELWAELSPLSILDLKAGLEPVFYFGTFGHLVSFPSYGSDFSKEAREAIKDQAVSRTGIRYYVRPDREDEGGPDHRAQRGGIRVVAGRRAGRVLLRAVARHASRFRRGRVDGVVQPAPLRVPERCRRPEAPGRALPRPDRRVRRPGQPASTARAARGLDAGRAAPRPARADRDRRRHLLISRTRRRMAGSGDSSR